MIVIADPTPINYLILIGELEILEKLYGRVLIPTTVFDELNADATPKEVKNWLLKIPEWFEVKSISSEISEDLKILDPGESEAIQLATETNADLLIIDERIGRKIAEEHGLKIIGTIGVLASAKKKDLINVEVVIEKLEKTNFYLSENLKDFLRKQKS